jgi:hypothetical protein
MAPVADVPAALPTLFHSSLAKMQPLFSMPKPKYCQSDYVAIIRKITPHCTIETSTHDENYSEKGPRYLVDNRG